MNMKLRKAALYILLIIVFGCSKDKIDSPINGKWEAISFTTSIPVDVNLDGTKNTDLKKEMSCVSMKANFSSRGNFTFESTSVTYDISVVNGEVILKPSGCGVQNENGTWKTDESLTQLFLEFIVEGNPEKTPLTVAIELSGDRLVMKDLYYKEVNSETVTYSIEFKKA